MSFLAQLRQQKIGAPSGLQLGYWLARRDQALELTLQVAEMQGREMRGAWRPYQLRRDHLRSPPPFIQPEDLPLLAELVSVSDDWLARPQGTCLPEDLEDFLSRLAATGKAYVALTAQQWLPLQLGQGISLTPCWRIDTGGRQHPDWHCPEGASVVWAGGTAVVFAPEQGLVSPGRHNLNDRALDAWREQSSLAPEQVAEFVAEREAQWQALGLPMPRQLPESPCSAQVTPLLVCRSVPDPSAPSQLRHELELMVRGSDDFWCVSRSLSGQAEYCWDGEYLHKVALEAGWAEEHREQVCLLLQDFFELEPNVWSTTTAKAWQRVLLDSREQLEEQGFALYIEPDFQLHYVVAENWRVHTADEGNGQWRLNVSFSAGEQRFDLFDLLRQLHLFNRDYLQDSEVALPDGRILLLSSELLGGLLDELGDWISFGSASGKVPNSQVYRLQELRSLLPEQTEWLDPDQLLKRADRLRASPLLRGEDTGIQAQLRPYQWLGVCWLQHVHNQGINGLLADDMGLGKTLQTLAHLSSQQRQGALTGPALIVAPTSLVSNWAAEARRFCPHLSCLIMHGGQRQKHWSELQAYALVITSYHCLARDLDQWQEQSLSWLILDEAQVIKNPRAQLTQAVRTLECPNKLALSGTPLANHLGELWSVLDFLNPKVLGSWQQFRGYYQKPIEEEGNNTRLQQLLKRIAPLILRRTKDQVARDLPPKTVVQQTLPLGQEQRAFYQQLKKQSWQNLQDQMADTESLGQKHLLVLTALLKLRQACCDPELLGERDIPSAKRDYCLEMVAELVAEGRSVLIFSQFTSVLDILARELDQQAIDYFMLTGETQNRAQLVANFQAGQAPVFLISLKAGGVGLNLTRADTVIHYDPWWNAAAEHQASDRAHRIGQDKPVFVYKLIAEETIEEKIALLQQVKAGLSQQIDQQGQASGQAFALHLEELLALWQEEQEYTHL